MDFLILKVNGQDVSKASHEDAVRAFQSAQEPIVVEVLRRAASGGLRNDANRNVKPAGETSVEEGVTVSTQTDPWNWPCSPEFPPAPAFLDDDDIDESFEDGGDPEVDFEEVTLHRSSTSERLGLTLYYPDGDEAPDETDVLVRGVEAGGIAARDGRIQPGDQIIQINGEEVASKEQAERLLSSRADVVLLLCRPVEQANDDLPVEQNEADQGSRSPQVICRQPLDNRVTEGLSPSADISGDRGGSLEKRDTMKSGGSSSSGSSAGSRGRRSAPAPAPTPSLPAGELTMDRELYLVNKQMASIQQECESLARRQHGERPLVPVPERRPQVEDHIYETIPECSESDEPLYCQPYTPAALPARSAPESRSRRDVERWIKASVTPPEPEPWHGTSSTNDSQSSAEGRPRRPGKEEEKDSSSAYNTGDSGRSGALTLELGLVTDEASREMRESTLTLSAPPAAPTRDLSLQVSLDSDTYSEVSCKNCRKCMRLPPLQQTPTKNKNVINSVNTVEKNKNYVTFLPYQTHYTNAENLQETIQRQQRQLYQQIMRKSQRSSQPCSPSQPVGRPPAPFANSLQQYRYVSSPGGAGRNHSHTLPADRGQDESPQFQYKVKVRSDGSRYIARRPVRKQLLKDRAARISEERAGITTDDDAMSELKLGRYWPRDEKKRHLERARERKQKQQQRAKMAAVPEEAVPEDAAGGKRQVIHPLLEASIQRRTSSASMRKKPHGQEEFLKHAKPPKPAADALLSVTTV
ncbi:E3 ubiquitin-protein ligase PDZRN3-B-like isoform X2 [Amphibalanus amphitrite]|uniref:E3 ubiquitin-protein ligase PDZRN3-B-like isoform X2 n=1 Tax=Amphibalanus amphitrite TaxID=1232801 RepID=UPI001C8FE5A3|nr:E3 ubiquitin-protein ligase PDZRN3-B-like isoform X2 [Amphibalanus amphitrite]